MTNSIKFINNGKKIKLNGMLYKPYMIGELPNLFAFKYDEDNDRSGIIEWFNYKGLTYIQD
jgi:hypothetical protein